MNMNDSGAPPHFGKPTDDMKCLYQRFITVHGHSETKMFSRGLIRSHESESN